MNVKTVEAIQGPVVIMTDGSGYNRSDIKGNIKPGAGIDIDTMEVTVNTANSDCPTGVCPIR